MHRLFVAIRPPVPVRNALLAIMGGIGGARWQNDDQLHVTLRFIGEVGRHRAEDVAAALGSLRSGRFDMALAGLGVFERRGNPETLWAGVTPHAPLHALHKKIDQAVTRVGCPPDRRAYAPHITLARLRSESREVQAFLSQHGDLASAPFPVDSFALFESALTPGGAIYSMVERYSLP